MASAPPDGRRDQRRGCPWPAWPAPAGRRAVPSAPAGGTGGAAPRGRGCRPGRATGSARTRPNSDAQRQPHGRAAGQGAEQHGGVDGGAGHDGDDAQAELHAEAGAVDPAAVAPEPGLVDLAAPGRQPQPAPPAGPGAARPAAAPRRGRRRSGSRATTPAAASPARRRAAPTRGPTQDRPEDVRRHGHPPARGSGPLAERADAGQHRLTSRGPGRAHGRDRRHRQPQRERDRCGVHRPVGRVPVVRPHRGLGRLRRLVQARVPRVDPGAEQLTVDGGEVVPRPGRCRSRRARARSRGPPRRRPRPGP